MAQNEGWFRNRGTHSDLVNDGVIVEGGRQHLVQCALYIEASVTTNDRDIEDKYGLYRCAMDNVTITHET